MTRRAPLVLAIVALAASASAQPPVGQSARLFGVHDLTGTSIAYLQGATESCDKGWITNLTYVEGDASTVVPPAGVSMIARLDWSGSASVPVDAGTRGAFVDRFVESVRRSPDTHVWIVGNEPNFTISGPWPGSHEGYIEPYVEPFVDAYARIRPAVHALPGHASDVVLLPAPSPWSPCFLEGLARIIRGIDARGVAIDGFAIHPGTRHPSDAQRAERVTADEAFHSCDIAPYTDGSGQFRVLLDFVRVIDGEGHAGAPIFITESAHNTDAGGVVNHVDEDRGFFTAIYAEVAAWNAANGNRIRAVTPYRWTTNGDGTGRDHSLEGKPALLADHRRAIDHTWTSVACGVTPVDAGTALGDGGWTPPPIDAGTGSPSTDAGATPPRVDASRVDAGLDGDAGPSGGGLSSGCGCGVGSGAGSPLALVALALALVSARRRGA